MKIPWYLKMGAKLILAQIPLPYRIWKKIGVFKYGRMQEFKYAHSIFVHHLGIAGLESADKNIQKILLELGPGDSLFSTLLARAYGFKGSFLVDVGNFALSNVIIYRQFAEWLKLHELRVPDLNDATNMNDVLFLLNADYRINGLESLKSIPDKSVDFIFSHSVLQLVKRSEFTDTIMEIRRILAPGGVSTHVIDLRDTLQESLNNLRFNPTFWESKVVYSSGFYTNRLRYNELMDIFSSAGFDVSVASKTEWKTLPVPKKLLNSRFKAMPDDILRINEFTIQLQ